MFKLSILDKISFLLVLVGSFNWGMEGIFKLNLIGLCVGGSIFLQRIIFTAIFIASLDLIYLVFKCKTFK